MLPCEMCIHGEVRGNKQVSSATQNQAPEACFSLVLL